MVRELKESCNPVSDAVSWADCVQVTLQADKLMEIIVGIDFTHAGLVGLTGYIISVTINGALIRALRPYI